jgi:hypothetical protein
LTLDNRRFDAAETLVEQSKALPAAGIGHLSDRQRPVDIGGGAMTLLLHGDDLTRLCQGIDL